MMMRHPVGFLDSGAVGRRSTHWHLIRKRPVATAGVALAAGLAAVLQPKLAATLVKAFMAKSGDRKAR